MTVSSKARQKLNSTFVRHCCWLFWLLSLITYSGCCLDMNLKNLVPHQNGNRSICSCAQTRWKLLVLWTYCDSHRWSFKSWQISLVDWQITFHPPCWLCFSFEVKCPIEKLLISSGLKPPILVISVEEAAVVCANKGGIGLVPSRQMGAPAHKFFPVWFQVVCLNRRGINQIKMWTGDWDLCVSQMNWNLPWRCARIRLFVTWAQDNTTAQKKELCTGKKAEPAQPMHISQNKTLFHLNLSSLCFPTWDLFPDCSWHCVCLLCCLSCRSRGLSELVFTDGESFWVYQVKLLIKSGYLTVLFTLWCTLSTFHLQQE